jgi:hypothetical protein
MAALREELAKAQAQASRADAEAKSMALEQAGVVADLRETVAATLTRQGDETWTQAVARDKVARPSAYTTSVHYRQAALPQGAALPAPAATPKLTGRSLDGAQIVR